MTFPTAWPGESRSRKNRSRPTRNSGAESSSPRDGRSCSSIGLSSRTHSGAVSWRKMALALVVALLARTKSRTVNAYATATAATPRSGRRRVWGKRAAMKSAATAERPKLICHPLSWQSLIAAPAVDQRVAAARISQGPVRRPPFWRVSSFTSSGRRGRRALIPDEAPAHRLPCGGQLDVGWGGGHEDLHAHRRRRTDGALRRRPGGQGRPAGRRLRRGGRAQRVHRRGARRRPRRAGPVVPGPPGPALHRRRGARHAAGHQGRRPHSSRARGVDRSHGEPHRRAAGHAPAADPLHPPRRHAGQRRAAPRAHRVPPCRAGGGAALPRRPGGGADLAVPQPAVRLPLRPGAGGESPGRGRRTCRGFQAGSRRPDRRRSGRSRCGPWPSRRGSTCAGSPGPSRSPRRCSSSGWRPGWAPTWTGSPSAPRTGWTRGGCCPTRAPWWRWRATTGRTPPGRRARPSPATRVGATTTRRCGTGSAPSAGCSAHSGRACGPTARWTTARSWRRCGPRGRASGASPRNGCLVTPRFGSWVVLAVLLLELEVDAYADGPAADRCGTCRLCIDAVPDRRARRGGAGGLAGLPLVPDHRERGRRCPPEHREAMAPHVFGCDVCQDVCPLNVAPLPAVGPRFLPRPVAGLDARGLAAMTPERYAELVPGTAARPGRVRRAASQCRVRARGRARRPRPAGAGKAGAGPERCGE